MFLAFELSRPLEMPAHMSFWFDAQSNGLVMVDAWGDVHVSCQNPLQPGLEYPEPQGASSGLIV